MYIDQSFFVGNRFHDGLLLFINSDHMHAVWSSKWSFCYVGPANRAANPLSVEFSDTSSTRTACCFPKTSIRGKLSILTSLRNN